MKPAFAKLLLFTTASLLMLSACAPAVSGTRQPPPVPTLDTIRKTKADPVGQNASHAPTRPSSGCGQKPETLIGATSTVKIKVNGMERIYLLHIPAGYDPQIPMPLVLSIHGYTDTAGGMEGTGMSRHADKYNYIVIYPQATNFKSNGKLITSWNDLTCNASPGPEGPICTANHTQYAVPSDCGPEVTKDSCNWCTCNDDLSYINQVLDETEASLCVDLNRVYATGMSNGGMFTNRLGCNLAERFAAIAPVSGTLAKGFNCAPDSSTPISIMYIHGREDDYVDVTGKTSTDGYLYTSVDELTALWASDQSQGCDEEVTPYPTIADGISGLSCTQHKDCKTGAEIVSCWWNAGHAWPGGSSPWGNDMIWDFFLKNPKNIQP